MSSECTQEGDYPSDERERIDTNECPVIKSIIFDAVEIRLVINVPASRTSQK